MCVCVCVCVCVVVSCVVWCCCCCVFVWVTCFSSYRTGGQRRAVVKDRAPPRGQAAFTHRDAARLRSSASPGSEATPLRGRAARDAGSSLRRGLCPTRLQNGVEGGRVLEYLRRVSLNLEGLRRAGGGRGRARDDGGAGVGPAAGGGGGEEAPGLHRQAQG